MSYHLYRVSVVDGGFPATADALRAQAGVAAWGVFPAIFGLGTDEGYLVTNAAMDAGELADGGWSVRHSCTLEPTARPAEFAPRVDAGIYVFRWFHADPANVDRIVSLSETAWETFESDFDTAVQALFRVTDSSGEPDKAEDGATMLLVTWYRDLAVWQASRLPDSRARENFVARQALMRRAVPIATRL